MKDNEQNHFCFTWKGKNINCIVTAVLVFSISVLWAFLLDKTLNQHYFWLRTLFFFFVGELCYFIRPNAVIHSTKLFDSGIKTQVTCIIVITITCFIAAGSMRIGKWWSVQGPDYQYQYEHMTEAVLDGHLYLDMKVAPELEAMQNPYDAVARSEQDIPFYWDHAYYNHHYYMYFGIVPVLVLFVPLKLIGITLLSYQATQIFTILIILGIFSLLKEIVKKMCPEISLSAYLSIAVACSWITIWYGVKYPAMYCTANTGGICFSIWGFYFCYKAFVSATDSKKQYGYIAIGALCSALTFGCRPTIGLACIILLPLIVHYLYQCEDLKKFIRRMIVFCIPFLVVAVLLMLYNYVRFDNPFEFGQSYQLTIVDQHNYMNNEIKPEAILNGLLYHFFHYEGIDGFFPYIHHDGNFVLFPVLLLGLQSFCLTNQKERGNSMVKGLAVMIGIAIILITAYHVIWAPVVFTRYSMDFNFLSCYLVMFGICGMFWNNNNTKKLSFWLTLFSIYTFIICFLLFFVAYDYSVADMQPEIFDRVKEFLIFWKR